MQGAACTQDSSGSALSASVQHGMAQQDAAGAAGPQHETPPVQPAVCSRRHISARAAAAETSTECFARLEALVGQPEGLLGTHCLLNMLLYHRHKACPVELFIISAVLHCILAVKPYCLYREAVHSVGVWSC